jgi:tetratricopeptide (TPR) repeat protein
VFRGCFSRTRSRGCRPSRLRAGLVAIGLIWGLLGVTPARAQTGQSQLVEIRVHVTDWDSEAVMDQVRVELIRFPSEIVETIFTDSSGYAQFDGIQSDNYIVRATKYGYNTAETRVEIVPHQNLVYAPVRMKRVGGDAFTSAPGSTVSARELSIPERARDEFHRGLKFLSEKKDPKQGMVHFQNAIANFPNYYEAYFLLGMAHLQTNSPSEGQAALRKAIELNPKFLEPYYPLADLLVRQKQYDEAEHLLLQALAQDKQDWRWPFELAFSYAKHGQWDKAMEYGQMASAQPGAPSKVHLLMADLYSNTGNTSKAVAELEEFEKIDPHSSYIPRVQQVLSELRKQNLTSQQKPAAARPEH